MTVFSFETQFCKPLPQDADNLVDGVRTQPGMTRRLEMGRTVLGRECGSEAETECVDKDLVQVHAEPTGRGGKAKC